MVYAFLIHSLGKVDKDSTQPPTSVEIYLSNFYETNGDHCDVLGQAIAVSVARYYWQQARYDSGLALVGPRKQVSSGDKKSQTSKTNQNVSEGLFYLPTSTLLDAPKIVLWRRQEASLFSIVCHLDENRLQAGHFLMFFTKILIEHFKNANICAQPREFLMKPDEVIALLQLYLPNGQMILMNSAYTKQVKREAESAGLTK